ncbi:hypothetical protein FACS18948_3070 [Clostridia bacterium]|nr:hypothetical protein FACS18948_3070 [Clostridia bacterium]
MTLGEALQIARTHGNHKMTAAELASASGTTARSINNWEKSISTPDALTLTRILTALRLPFDVLMSVISDDYAAAYRGMTASIADDLSPDMSEELWNGIKTLTSRP